MSEQEKIYTKIKTLKTERTNQKRTNILNNLIDNEKYALELASEKGASNWLMHCHLADIILTWINPNSGMEFISDIDGNQPTFHYFDLTHVLHCERVDTPTWGITKSEIPLPTSLARFALMLKSSRNFSRCKARALSTIQPQLMKTLD